MKAGSVVVDLAAQTGGNVAATRKDEMYVTDNGVTCIGYTDINSRLASTSSALYANNQMKWILSAGPTTTKTKGEFALDYEDIAVRGMMIMDKGEMTWPWTPPAPPPPPPKKETVVVVKTDADYEAEYVASAKRASIGAMTALGASDGSNRRHRHQPHGLLLPPRELANSCVRRAARGLSSLGDCCCRLGSSRVRVRRRRGSHVVTASGLVRGRPRPHLSEPCLLVNVLHLLPLGCDRLPSGVGRRARAALAPDGRDQRHLGHDRRRRHVRHGRRCPPRHVC
jgi:hypothetical protein